MPAEIVIELRQTAATTTEAAIRAHRLRIDRPADKGGMDLGPMGGELFLASIGGCFLSNLLAAIRARDLPISDVRAEVIGRLADAPPRFDRVELRVSASGDPEALRHVVAIADRACIMMNTLRGKLDVAIVIAP